MIKFIIHYRTIKKVEEALGFKLRKWQIDYIFSKKDKDQILIIRSNNRACGKTIAHQLRLLLNYRAPTLDTRSSFIKYTDYRSTTASETNRYAKWYIRQLHDLYETLKANKIKVRDIKF